MANLSIYQNDLMPKISSPFENAAMAAQIQQGQNQNRLAQRQFQEADRADMERNALADLYRNSVGDDGSIDYRKVTSGLAAGGYGDKVAGIVKQQNEAAASGVELNNKTLTGQKLQDDITHEQKTRAIAKIGAFIQDPNLSADMLLADLQNQVQIGELKFEQAQGLAQQIQGKTSEQLRPLLTNMLNGMLTPQQQMASRDPNKPFNADGTPNKEFQEYEVKKAQSGASSIQNFGSPVSAIDPRNGKPVLIQTGNRGGVNVLDYAPPPKEEKPFTEAENNSAGYLGRMRAAEKALGGLQGGELTEKTAVAGSVPFVGSYVQGKVMNPTQQRYKQAADDWIRAKLRKESGAVIGADEMAAEYKTYFPQPADSPELIAQKAQARRQAEAQIMQSAGRAGEAMQAKDDSRYTQQRFSKSEMDYVSAQKAKGVPESEIIRALNSGQHKKTSKPAGKVKFLGFE